MLLSLNKISIRVAKALSWNSISMKVLGTSTSYLAFALISSVL